MSGVQVSPGPPGRPGRPPSSRAARPAISRRGYAAWLVLFLVSAAMVYGTWLAVDDMGAKPMRAHVVLAADALTIVNDSSFTWSQAAFTVNDAYTTAVVDTVSPGASVTLPLSAFVDAQGRSLTWTRPPVREVAATATRQARFKAFNVDHTTSGRWPVP